MLNVTLQQEAKSLGCLTWTHQKALWLQQFSAFLACKPSLARLQSRPYRPLVSLCGLFQMLLHPTIQEILFWLEEFHNRPKLGCPLQSYNVFKKWIILRTRTPNKIGRWKNWIWQNVSLVGSTDFLTHCVLMRSFTSQLCYSYIKYQRNIPI